MKALTICQPYAGLICDGRKRIENRRWSPRYRGDLIIHAGKPHVFMETWDPDHDGPWPDPMPFGAVVGTAQLTAIYSMKAIGRNRIQLPENHQWILAYYHTEGPFLRVLEDVQTFKEPIPWKGAQGLWDASDLVSSNEWMFAEFEPVKQISKVSGKQ